MGPPHVLTADDRTDDRPRVDLDALAALLARVLELEGVDGSAEASLTLVDPEAIAALKAEHLDGDGSPTDVLSFPIDGDAGPGEAGGSRSMVGDVVVCPRVAEAQAPDHAGSLDDELALLVVHAGLHLVGWDHADEGERAAMWSRERELLHTLHGAPELDPWGETAS